MGGLLSLSLVGCRSRRDKFKTDVAGKKLNRIQKCRTQARRQKLHCREPSRIHILQKVLTRVFSKSRKLRRLVRRAISKNFPKSLYMYIHNYVRFISLYSAKK